MNSGSIAEPRLVCFSTTEGTWTSVDVSPDGQTIIFDLLGDIYALAVSGGRAHPLTSGPAWDSNPRFAPDGQHIAFLSDRSGLPNLWIADRAGNHAKQISAVRPNLYGEYPISSPAWAPDGRSVVVSQRMESVKPAMGSWALRGKWLLAEYDVSTSRMRWVTDTTPGTARAALGAVYSRDGFTLYAAVEPASATNFNQGAWHIERIVRSTGSFAPETPPWIGRAGVRPVTSPNGRWLAYVSESGTRMGLRLRDLQTYRERWLVPDQLDFAVPWGGQIGGLEFAPGYTFTPDSRALIIAFGGKIHWIDLVTGRDRVIPFVVEVQRELAPMVVHQLAVSDTAVRTRIVMQPALSPDGRQVAFSALDRLYVMDLPLEGQTVARPRRLTSDSTGEFYPSWSPDGRWIAYSSWRDGEGGMVRRAWMEPTNKGSTAPSELVSRDTALYFNTAVTPDGQRVVAVRAAAPRGRLLEHHELRRPEVSLVALPSTGGFPTNIKHLGAADSYAPSDETARPNRLPIEQLYFTSDAKRIHVGLTSFAWDGTDVRPTIVVRDSLTPDRVMNDITGVVAPDGRRALLTHRWALSEVTFPRGRGGGLDTLNLEEAQRRKFGVTEGAARRWGHALAPWISWSRDGSRALFVQGGSLFIGDIYGNSWAVFERVDVPLLIPVDTPRGTLVLRGARIITMRDRSLRTGSSPEVIPSGDIVVRDSRIAAIGRTGRVPFPASATVFDVTGKTVLPGYVDIHDHLGVPYGVHPGQWWAMLVRLAHGVTTLRDPYAPQLQYNDIFSYSERERAGDLVGPRVFSTGIPHTLTDRPVDNLEDAHALVYPTAEYFNAETFKEYSSDPWPSRRLIAQAAGLAGLNATIHGDPLRAVVDGWSGVEHNFPLPLHADALTLVARSGITQTNTFGTTAGAYGTMLTTGCEPWASARMRRFVQPAIRRFKREEWSSAMERFGHPESDALNPILRVAGRLTATGGNVAMGSHNFPGVGIHYEMWFHAMGGMPFHDILRGATIVSATAIGHARDLGSLDVGKLADLQILDRNPLDDIKNTVSIRYLMKNGRLHRADDLAEIWPRHRPMASIYLFTDLQQGCADTSTSVGHTASQSARPRFEKSPGHARATSSEMLQSAGH